MEQVSVESFVKSLAKLSERLGEMTCSCRTARAQIQLKRIFSSALLSLGELFGESIQLTEILFPPHCDFSTETCFVNAEAFGLPFSVELPIDFTKRISTFIQQTIPPRWQEEQLLDEMRAVDFASSWTACTNPQAVVQNIRVYGASRVNEMKGEEFETTVVGGRVVWGEYQYFLRCIISAPLMHRILLYAENSPLMVQRWGHLTFIYEMNLYGTVELGDEKLAESSKLSVDVSRRELVTRIN